MRHCLLYSRQEEDGGRCHKLVESWLIHHLPHKGLEESLCKLLVYGLIKHIHIGREEEELTLFHSRFDKIDIFLIEIFYRLAVGRRFF